MVVRYLAHTQISMTGPRSREGFSNMFAKSVQFTIQSFPNRMTNGVVSYVGFDPLMLLEDLRHDRYCCCMATTMRVCQLPTLECWLKRTALPICKSFLVLVIDFVTTRERSLYCLDG
jgi:hypothetical protein